MNYSSLPFYHIHCLNKQQNQKTKTLSKAGRRICRLILFLFGFITEGSISTNILYLHSGEHSSKAERVGSGRGWRCEARDVEIMCRNVTTWSVRWKCQGSYWTSLQLAFGEASCSVKLVKTVTVHYNKQICTEYFLTWSAGVLRVRMKELMALYFCTWHRPSIKSADLSSQSFLLIMIFLWAPWTTFFHRCFFYYMWLTGDIDIDFIAVF